MNFSSETFNWIATGLCAFFSAKSALIIGRKSSQIFAVLALFSLCWALLLPYYSAPAPPELFSGFSGFLLVCVGLLLARKAHPVPPPQNTPGSTLRHWFTAQGPVAVAGQAALTLLIVLITSLLRFRTTGPKVALVIATVLTVIGYYAICKGIQVYSSTETDWKYLAGIAIPYALAELAYTIYALLPGALKPMPWPFLIAFGTFKLLFSAIFVYLLVKKHVSSAAGHQPITDFFYLVLQVILVFFFWPGHDMPIPGPDDL